MKGNLKTELAVIADDFTGSNDTGLQFRKKGAKTGVIFNLSDAGTALRELDVVVADTESRFDDKETAYEKVNKLSGFLKDAGIQHIYKKIDSTMRGNIGSEIDGLLNGYGAKAALVAPSYPSFGRTVRDGTCFLKGVPVEKTEMAKDPRTPVSNSHIPSIIRHQSKRRIASIGMEIICRGSAEILSEIDSLLEKDWEIIVLDAVTDKDLLSIAQVYNSLNEKIVMVGSAGFAEHISLTKEKKVSGESFIKRETERQDNESIIIVAGSVSEVTMEQISFAESENFVRTIDLNLEALFSGKEKAEKDRIINETLKLFSQKKNVVIRSAVSKEDIEVSQRLGKKSGLNLFGIGEKIARLLGEVTEKICGTVRVGGLVLTGGDTAIKTAEAMNISRTMIIAEVLPSISMSYFISDTFGEIPVVTKSGAFGEKDSIVKIIDFIKNNLY